MHVRKKSGLNSSDMHLSRQQLVKGLFVVALTQMGTSRKVVKQDNSCR